MSSSKLIPGCHWLITHWLQRMQAQFDHLAETYFNGFEHDLGERELGYAVSFDHDLDIFSASIGLTKTSIMAIIKDEGITHFSTQLTLRWCHLDVDALHDMGDLDPENDLFDPLQKLLNQCKSAKVLSKWTKSILNSFCFWLIFLSGNSPNALRISYTTLLHLNPIFYLNWRIWATLFQKSSTLAFQYVPHLQY